MTYIAAIAPRIESSQSARLSIAIVSYSLTGNITIG